MPNNETDIRWQQRFANYCKALKKLSDAVEYVQEELAAGTKIEELDQLKLEGLIQRFEYTHELAWNVMKDFAIYQGNNTLTGSRDAIREALAMGLITDQRWMNTISDRNRTSHTYNEATAFEILDDIVNVYHSLFIDFEAKMEELLLNK